MIHINQYKVKYDVGYRDRNNNGQWYTIIKKIKGQKNPRKQARFIVKFDETGYESEVVGTAIKSGKIKDRYSKDILGIACIGDVKKVDHKREYNIWYQMISRCHNRKDSRYDNYGGKGVYVCDRWLCFENFVNDIYDIDGYNDEEFRKGLLHLDKDIKQRHSETKVYSPETCTFTDAKTNNSKENRSTTSYKEGIIGVYEGNIYKINDIPKFAKENDMFTSYIYKCLRGEKKSYKGWEFKFS